MELFDEAKQAIACHKFFEKSVFSEVDYYVYNLRVFYEPWEELVSLFYTAEVIIPEEDGSYCGKQYDACIEIPEKEFGFL